MKRFTRIFLPHNLAMEILQDENFMNELRGKKENCSITWNERFIYDYRQAHQIVIAFIPEEVASEIPRFFKYAEGNERIFVFTEKKMFERKAKTPSGKETCRVINKVEYSHVLMTEAMRFMRAEFS